MTKSRMGLLAACGLLAAPAAAAEVQQTSTRGGFELGVEVFDYGYRERDDGATIVRDDGTFGGATASYVETVGSGWFLKARLSLGWGSVDYASDEGSSLQNVPQDVGQMELLVGRDFAVGVATLTPFAGVAARVLNDNSGGRTSSDGLIGYDREVSYGYWPVGLSARVAMNPRASLMLSGQANFVTGGEVVSRFSKIDPTVRDVKLDLKDGIGWELAASVILPVGRRQLTVGPFARGWRIDRSTSAMFVDTDGTIELFEPKNRTLEAGVRATLSF